MTSDQNNLVNVIRLLVPEPPIEIRFDDLVKRRRRARLRQASLVVGLAILAAIAIVVPVSLAGSDTHAHVTAPATVVIPSPTPVNTATPFTFPSGDRVLLQNGDQHSERFCAVSPARGSISYVVRGRFAYLHVNLSHVTPRAFPGLAWSSPGHGGEVIASIHFDSHGRSEPRTLRFFHSPYYQEHATAIDLVTVTNGDHIVATARAC